ncbi:MAG: GGDEF domain-containing protein [Burkholderiales bacterium]|uniref:GGDEF domain-containing protein n=1 Tax=Inhella sp. TaxID=1921806 RepID=UPI001ACD433A|nr:GGDEF domain-containing protein [Burkholderiales bacterium]
MTDFSQTTQLPSEATDLPVAPRWAWLLGVERKHRIRSGQSLLALGLVVLGLIWGLVAGRRADTDWIWLLPWAAVALGGQAVCAFLVCSGRSSAWRDPALTQAQCALTLVLTHAAYPMTGESRVAVFPIAMVILMFATFDLRPRLVAQLALLSLASLGAAMAFAVEIWPRKLPWSSELPLLVMMVVLVPGVWVLATRMAHIRQRLVRQREEVREAMAKLQTLAERDALTGLFNRHQGERLLARALRRHQRSGTSFAVALIDLDHFKQVNDRHGHAAGDAVLRHFAKVAQRCLRDTDTLARWGGEEFLVLLDDAHLDATRTTIERLRQAVQMNPVPLERGSLGVTASVGATVARRGESAEPLLRRADAALYRAKSNGRNRVELDA